MLKKDTFQFDTLAEANAFKAGVEYVNDSAIFACLNKRKRRCFEVICLDADGQEDE